MPNYYLIYSGHGRLILADELGAEDPFSLDPRVIVERVVAAGYTPLVDRVDAAGHTPLVARPRPSPMPLPATGAAFETRDADGRTYLVTIGRDAETIAVQEVRADGDRYESE